jgi:hypothetical protein
MDGIVFLPESFLNFFGLAAASPPQQYRTVRYFNLWTKANGIADTAKPPEIASYVQISAVRREAASWAAFVPARDHDRPESSCAWRKCIQLPIERKSGNLSWD